MTQQTLWCHNNEWLSKFSNQLTPEDMKEIRRCGAIYNLHVVFSTQGKEPFEAGAGMFSTLAFVTMRQEHHQAIHPLPFILSATDILVDYYLSAICEIAELCFPDHECIRCR